MKARSKDKRIVSLLSCPVFPGPGQPAGWEGVLSLRLAGGPHSKQTWPNPVLLPPHQVTRGSLGFRVSNCGTLSSGPAPSATRSEGAPTVGSSSGSGSHTPPAPPSAILRLEGANRGPWNHCFCPIQPSLQSLVMTGADTRQVASFCA